MIRIFGSAEGGRAKPPYNGIRWDFAYAESQPVDELYAIYPDFCNERGDSLPTDQPLPIAIEIPARMTVPSDEMRVKLHRLRIREGSRFYCHEGPKRVAEGRVTRVTGLFKERPSR